MSRANYRLHFCLLLGGKINAINYTLAKIEQNITFIFSNWLIFRPFMNYFAHPTAVIDPGAAIGSGTRILAFFPYMPGATIGED